MKKVYLFTLILILVAQNAFAQIFTDKTRVEIQAETGVTHIEEIVVYNTTNDHLDLKVYWQDFVYLPPYDGKKDFLPIGTSEYSLNDAVGFSPQELSLPAQGNAKVSVSIQIPDEARGGGYYGVLFYEKSEPTVAPGTGLKIVTRLGTLFFIETNWRDKSADVQNISASGNGLKGDFINQGNLFLTPKGTFYLLDTDNMVTDRGTIKKIYLTPGAQAEFRMSLSEELPRGKYTAIITFDLKGGESLVREVDVQKYADGRLEVLAVRE